MRDKKIKKFFQKSIDLFFKMIYNRFRKRKEKEKIKMND